MSVHQVESYYIHIKILNESKTRELLTSAGLEDFFFENGFVTVDGFDCESEAEDIESKIINLNTL